ncbi:hypothetical protein ADILRU_0598 [Leifsonia rubra CMS 76R]|nr:hypothetical protein ADILRU_0598 [Leifsonia rubra CMS 76R]
MLKPYAGEINSATGELVSVDQEGLLRGFRTADSIDFLPWRDRLL